MKFYWKEKILLSLYADWMGRTHHEYGSISTEVFLANNTKAYLHLMCAFTFIHLFTATSQAEILRCPTTLGDRKLRGKRHKVKPLLSYFANSLSLRKSSSPIKSQDSSTLKFDATSFIITRSS